MLTIFYDAKCGMCKREIEHYVKIAPKGTLVALDIIDNEKKIKELGLSMREALLYLHVVDEERKLYVGVHAFIMIWQHLKYWRLLAKLISIPGIHWIACKVYTLFAHLRFKRYAHCKRYE